MSRRWGAVVDVAVIAVGCGGAGIGASVTSAAAAVDTVAGAAPLVVFLGDELPDGLDHVFSASRNDLLGLLAEKQGHESIRRSVTPAELSVFASPGELSLYWGS